MIIKTTTPRHNSCCPSYSVVLAILLIGISSHVALAESKKVVIPIQSQQQFVQPGSKWAPDDGSRRKQRSHGAVSLVLPQDWKESVPLRSEGTVAWELPTFESGRNESITFLFLEGPRQRAVHDLANAPVSQLPRKDWSLIRDEEWKDKGDNFLNRGVAKLFRLKDGGPLVFAGAVDLRGITAVVAGEFDSEKSFDSTIELLRSLRHE